MRDEDLRGLRRLAEEQGDAASWSRLAAAHVRLGQWDEAGEALVRARAIGEADPAVEDALEDASLEDATLLESPREHTADARLLAWSADSRALYEGDRPGASHGPRWDAPRLVRRVYLGLRWTTSLAVDLEGRAYACFPDGSFGPYLVGFDPGDIEAEERAHVRLADHRYAFELACWGRPGLVHASDGARVQTFAFDGLDPRSKTPVASLERSKVSLCWNGDVVDWSERGATLLAKHLDRSEPALVPGRAIEAIAWASQRRTSVPTLRAAGAFAGRFETFRATRRLGHPLSHTGLAVSPSGRFAAAFDAREGSELGIEVTDLLASRTRVFRPSRPATSALWAPCGRRLAVALAQGLAVLELGARSAA